MNQWEIWKCDLGWGSHPVVIVSHPARAVRKDFVEVVDCASQRANRPALEHEVLLDEADGLGLADTSANVTAFLPSLAKN